MSTIFATRAGAVAFALIFSAFCDSAHAAVYVPEGVPLARLAIPMAPSAEPFNLTTSLLPEGPLQTKWQDVARAIEREAETLAACRTAPEACGSPAALRFLGIVQAASARTGIARLGEVNRAINLAIRPVSDMTQYGTEDHWSSPLATLTAGAGDCEDYAIAKLVALREAGVASDDLRLIILRGTATGEDHAVLAARVDGRWRMLDNRTLVMIDDTELNRESPLVAIDAEGVKRFEQPSAALAMAQRDNVPAAPALTSTSAEAANLDALALIL